VVVELTDYPPINKIFDYLILVILGSNDDTYFIVLCKSEISKFLQVSGQIYTTRRKCGQSVIRSELVPHNNAWHKIFTT
jgi:hypothetical protein